MNVMTKTQFDVVPLTKHIGAEIRGIDLREKPDAETVRAIYQAWLDHLVLIFPEQKLSQEDLIRATSFFGEMGKLSRPPKYFPKGYSEASARHHDDLQHPRERRADRRAAGRRDDVPSRHDPCRGAEQGDAALFGRNSVSRRQHAVRQRLCRLRHARSGDPQPARRQARRCTTTITARRIRGDSKGTEAFAECVHPVFRTHEDTGRKAVYVNRLMTVKVLDMPEEESDALLNAVFDHAEKPRIRLRARLARRRPAAVGQPLLVARAHRFSLDRAPADAAHHGQGHGAAILIHRRPAFATTTS